MKQLNYFVQLNLRVGVRDTIPQMGNLCRVEQTAVSVRKIIGDHLQVTAMMDLLSCLTPLSR